MKLNVGCGKDIKKGYVNIDTHKRNGANLVHELPRIILHWNKFEGEYWVDCVGSPLPYDDESIDEIYCSHVLEDFIYEFNAIIEDFHRVLKPGGKLHVKVPFEESYANHYHKRFFDKNTFRSLVASNEHYGDNGMFRKLELNRVNRYGLITCVQLVLFRKIIKLPVFLEFFNLKWGMRYEIEAVLIK